MGLHYAFMQRGGIRLRNYKKQLWKREVGGNKTLISDITLICSGSRHLECCLDEGRGVAHAARGSCNGRGPCSLSSALI